MTKEIMEAFETYLDHKPTDADLKSGFIFACGFAAGQEAAKKRRELKLITPSDELQNYFKGVTGVLEATHHEIVALYSECKKHPNWNLNLEQETGGYLPTIAMAEDGTSICLSVYLWTLNDAPILVYEATSRFVDHDLVDKWLKKFMPKTAFKEDGRLKKVTASNFHNLR